MFCIDRAAFLYAIASNVLCAVLAIGLPAVALLFIRCRKSRRPSLPAERVSPWR
jgi:hypothetical protein